VAYCLGGDPFSSAWSPGLYPRQRCTGRQWGRSRADTLWPDRRRGEDLYPRSSDYNKRLPAAGREAQLGSRANDFSTGAFTISCGKAFPEIRGDSQTRFPLLGPDAGHTVGRPTTIPAALRSSQRSSLAGFQLSLALDAASRQAVTRPGSPLNIQ